MMQFFWKFTKEGVYSASAAYNAQFEGHTASAMITTVWKAWAPPKCKFFAWLIIHNRVWTANRLQHRDGRIATFALFASRFKRRRPTSSSSVGSQWECGRRSRLGLASTTLIRQIGDSCPRWKFVGTWLLTKGATHAWFVALWWCLLRGKFGTNATRGFSATPPPILPLSLPRLKMRPLFGLVRVRSICVILCGESDLYSPAWRNYV